MVCILPASVPNHDVTFHIQQTLVEAFCVEHGIPILKVTITPSKRGGGGVRGEKLSGHDFPTLVYM